MGSGMQCATFSTFNKSQQENFRRLLVGRCFWYSLKCALHHQFREATRPLDPPGAASVQNVFSSWLWLWSRPSRRRRCPFSSLSFCACRVSRFILIARTSWKIFALIFPTVSPNFTARGAYCVLQRNASLLYVALPRKHVARDAARCIA